MRKIAFIIPPTVELLDLAGPVQVFTEAKFYGLDLETEFLIYSKDPVSTCGLRFGEIGSFEQARLKEGDFVFFPGMDQSYVRSTSFNSEHSFFKWLKECSDRGVRVCSVCNGAFALGRASLLNGLECTTHWRRVDELQSLFPDAKVIPNVVYVKNEQVCTSGGISAGIDLALSILEDLTDFRFATKVARGLVVYPRRSIKDTPAATDFKFRNHIVVKVHETQDYILDNLDREPTIDQLASMVGMSSDGLSTTFREATGASIDEYMTALRQSSRNKQG
jgi:transcriptional regulator GlxA family with amidase domain